MDILFGMMLLAAFEGLAWFGWRAWCLATQPPAQPPQTPEQVANEQAFEAYEAATPRAVRLRLQRRRARGHFRNKI